MLGEIIGWLFWIAAGYTGFITFQKWNENLKLTLIDYVWIGICVVLLAAGLIYRFIS